MDLPVHLIQNLQVRLVQDPMDLRVQALQAVPQKLQVDAGSGQMQQANGNGLNLKPLPAKTLLMPMPMLGHLMILVLLIQAGLPFQMEPVCAHSQAGVLPPIPLKVQALDWTMLVAGLRQVLAQVTLDG